MLFFSYYSSEYSGLLDYLHCSIIQQSFLPSPQLFFFLIRASRPEVVCEKIVLINFTEFTGKLLCHSPFFNNAAGLTHATLLKKILWRRCFPVNSVNFLRTLFTEHLWVAASVLYISIEINNLKYTNRDL